MIRPRHATVLIRRFEPPSVILNEQGLPFGSTHGEGEELQGTSLVVSAPGVEKTRGTVVQTGPECKKLREGDAVILRPRDTTPPLYEGSDADGATIELWAEPQIICALRDIPVPKVFHHRLIDPKTGAPLFP